MRPKKYRNYLDIDKHIEGNEERLELLHDIMDKGAFKPKPIGYKDIDMAFKEWVSNTFKMSDDNGSPFPVMSLYTTQRFSEYSQTWRYTDDNGNIILNFLTIKRESNPQHGTILGGDWNIPGDRYYFLARKKVLDDNGSESFLDLKARQPKPVDLMYTVSVFTTKFEYLNKFNTILNTKFIDRQEYIFPNGYAIPMVVDNLSDSSQYNINDRQFYSQSAQIKTMAYIFNEDDFIMEEIPLKRKADIVSMPLRKKASVEIEDCDKHDPFYKQPIVLTMSFPKCKAEVTFNIDCAFTMVEADLGNNTLNNYKVWVNDEPRTERPLEKIENGDKITIRIGRRRYNEEAILKLYGYNPDVMFDENKDNPVFDDENSQNGLEYEITFGDNHEEGSEK